eukprot:TRINITY_DN28155_c0_g1_i1.p4 TRINITY_DN28155_c0_g1~~TRINITY_DN28155_c0_g1_i1.p4  ORF type:complete len:116 (+),score=4.60 TRINITY_DN28155_c0_g1_i1:277-624(+)
MLLPLQFILLRLGVQEFYQVAPFTRDSGDTCGPGALVHSRMNAIFKASLRTNSAKQFAREHVLLFIQLSIYQNLLKQGYLHFIINWQLETYWRRQVCTFIIELDNLKQLKFIAGL